jgi:hypothetical protein
LPTLYDSEQDSTVSQAKKIENIACYPVTFFACFLTFAQRFFAVLAILALPAAGEGRPIHRELPPRETRYGLQKACIDRLGRRINVVGCDESRHAYGSRADGR